MDTRMSSSPPLERDLLMSKEDEAYNTARCMHAIPYIRRHVTMVKSQFPVSIGGGRPGVPLRAGRRHI